MEKSSSEETITYQKERKTRTLQEMSGQLKVRSRRGWPGRSEVPRRARHRVGRRTEEDD